MALKESNKQRKKEKFEFVEEVTIEEPIIVKYGFEYLTWGIVGLFLLMFFIV